VPKSSTGVKVISIINLLLAEACHERGWAMGVGSQRRELDAAVADPSTNASTNSTIDQWPLLRARFPKVVLYGNLGISQVITTPVAQVRRLVESLHAQALMVHVNALQEALQPEGTPQFRGALPALKNLCSELDVPVVLKETGCGFGLETLRRLADTGLAGVDVSGLGGTHWGRIEGARAPEAGLQREAARTFAEWGVPTVDAVMHARQALGSGIDIWASGGVRTGLDAAKLIALGAHQIGFAKPALEAALGGETVLRDWMAAREYELKVALFCTGCESPSVLREKENIWKAIGV
jgi:isopentenyl-diphosphate delta-isomerase